MVAMRAVGASMYYVALLIVQSILMGATIDYAILFTSYYRESRTKATIQEAKDRMRYYFGEFGGTFPNNPQMQNVYDVLCRDDE